MSARSADVASRGITLGVVIPTLDEAAYLPALLADLRRLELPHRVVVVDGGSGDRTAEVAREAGAELLRASRGRAVQMNAGARALLDVPWLLFLHADSRVPSETRAALEAWIEEDGGGAEAAHFAFSLAGDDWFWRFLERGQRLRERLYGLPYGDQGLLVSRRAFDEVGGYPELPVMEDVEMVRRLRKRGEVRGLDAPVVTSPRRYERDGRWLGWLRNATLIGLHLAGVPAGRLARWYGVERTSGDGASPGHPRRRTLLLFAKAPTPGRVKTRLAAGIGEEEAAAVYRKLGRRVLEQVRGGAYRTVVCHDPPGAREEIARWLDADDVDYRPQEGPDLGARLERAIRRAFRGADRVCVVGTDVPGVDRSCVEAAFHALETGADVCFGPALDGGYYLVALRAPRPELFRRIPWSTDRALEVSLARAEALGLRVATLDPLADVDTPEDLEAWGG